MAQAIHLDPQHPAQLAHESQVTTEHPKVMSTLSLRQLGASGWAHSYGSNTVMPLIR